MRTNQFLQIQEKQWMKNNPVIKVGVDNDTGSTL